MDVRFLVVVGMRHKRQVKVLSSSPRMSNEATSCMMVVVAVDQAHRRHPGGLGS